MATTQKQLAERLGVSQMTVSYALRGADCIPEATRERVLKAARRMGYRFNAPARAMRGGRLNCVGILESTVGYRSSFFGGALFDGIHDTLAARDIHVTVSKLPDEKLTDERFVPKLLREVMADGLLINYFADVPPRLVELIERYQIPAVWINTRQKHDCVHPDDFAGACDATRRLIDLGHRRIGYADYEVIRPADLEPSDAVHYSILDRYRGYEQTMRRAGLTPRPLHEGYMLTQEQAMAAVRHQLVQPDRPTAMISYSTFSAGAILMAALSVGLRVPQDLSLINFEDSEHTPLCTEIDRMKHGWHRVGEAACNMLLRKIDKSGEPQPCQTLPFTYVPGRTTAAPPADLD